MEIQNDTLENFKQGFRSTEDLLNQLKNPQQPPTQPVQQPQPPVQQQIAPLDPNNPTPTPPAAPEPRKIEAKSTEEILAELAGEKPKDAVPELNEDGTPKEPVAPTEPAPDKKVKSNKLPDNFSEIVEALEEKGKLFGFVDGKYETIEDFIALIDENDKIKVNQLQQIAAEQLLASQTPASRAILQYAQMGVQDPKDLVPFLTAVDNYDYTAQLDPENAEHQEQIIRNALSIQNLPDDAIDAEITELREKEGKLASRAKQMKPILDKYNSDQITRIYQEKQREYQDELNYWNNNAAQVQKAVLESKTVGDLKMRQEHRQIAYAALSKPDPQLGGLGIYAIVDRLLEQGKFDVLAEMAVLGIDRKAYHGYVSAKELSSSAEKTERSLRVRSNPDTNLTDTDPKPNKIKRPGAGLRPSLDM